MSKDQELDFWLESREQWAALLEKPDQRDRDVLLSHKFAREQIAHIDQQIEKLAQE